MITAMLSVYPVRTDLARCGLATMVVASVVNTLLLTLILRARLVEPFTPFLYPPVVLLLTAGVVAVTFVYGLLTGRVIDVDRTFFRVAATVLMVSFLLDIGLLYVDPKAIMPGVLVLMLMHVVITAIYVASLIELGWGVPKGTNRTGPKSDRVAVVRAPFRMP